MTSTVDHFIPASLSMIANTSQGRMVGDYISTSWGGGTARPVFAVGRPPSGGAAFDEAHLHDDSGLGRWPRRPPRRDDPVLSHWGDQREAPLTRR